MTVIGFAVVRIHRGEPQQLALGHRFKRWRWVSFLNDELTQDDTTVFFVSRYRCFNPRGAALEAAKHQCAMRGGSVVAVTQ